MLVWRRKERPANFDEPRPYAFGGTVVRVVCETRTLSAQDLTASRRADWRKRAVY